MVIPTQIHLSAPWKKPTKRQRTSPSLFLGKRSAKTHSGRVVLSNIAFRPQPKGIDISYANYNVEKITLPLPFVRLFCFFVYFYFTLLSFLCQYISHRNYFFHISVVRHLTVILSKKNIPLLSEPSYSFFMRQEEKVCPLFRISPAPCFCIKKGARNGLLDFCVSHQITRWFLLRNRHLLFCRLHG